jgi:hypothetical protein
MPEQSYQKNDRQRYAEQPEQCASSEIHGSSPSFVKTDDAARREEFQERDEFAWPSDGSFADLPGTKTSSGRLRAPIFARCAALKHDPEKCAAVFRKDHAQTKPKAR